MPDPARELLDPELAGAHLAQHEADDAAVYLGDHRDFRGPPQVITDTALPDFRPVLAADLLVDTDDGADIQLVARGSHLVIARSSISMVPLPGAARITQLRIGTTLEISSM